MINLRLLWQLRVKDTISDRYRWIITWELGCHNNIAQKDSLEDVQCIETIPSGEIVIIMWLLRLWWGYEENQDDKYRRSCSHKYFTFMRNIDTKCSEVNCWSYNLAPYLREDLFVRKMWLTIQKTSKNRGKPHIFHKTDSCSHNFHHKPKWWLIVCDIQWNYDSVIKSLSQNGSVHW